MRIDKNLEKLTKEAIRSKVSEYFRALLREVQEEAEEARLEALFPEGLAGRADIPLVDQ